MASVGAIRVVNHHHILHTLIVQGDDGVCQVGRVKTVDKVGAHSVLLLDHHKASLGRGDVDAVDSLVGVDLFGGRA